MRINNLQHPDLHIVEPEADATALKVDQIRDLQRMLSLSPGMSNYRIAIIQDFQSANQSAQNAFLKTLEEPASSVVIILIAPDVESLLPTIVSRCEQLRLKPVPQEDLKAWISLESSMPDDRLETIAGISAGRPGFALRLVQENDVWERREGHIDELFDLLEKGVLERFRYIHDLAGNRSVQLRNELQDRFEIWVSVLRDALITSLDSGEQITNTDKKDFISRLAGVCSSSSLMNALETTRDVSQKISRNANPRLAAEVLMTELPFLKKTPISKRDTLIPAEVTDAKIS
jgi:DNA polymerase-3 subunit delta'